VSRSVSVGTKLQQLHGLLGTNDLTPWEQGFVRNVYDATGGGAHTSILSGNQVEKIDDMWTKHFA